MKLFIVLSVFVASALCARLDNTYIPPPNAHSAGGHNLQAPRQGFASNIQNSYAQPQQSHHREQHYSQGGANHGTFTSHQQGQGFQSVSSGAYSGQQQQPQANFGRQQSGQGYNQESTTPIPILKCKCSRSHSD